MKAPLKQPYETRHAEDLTALKKLYEHHAKDCVRVAELTVDPRRREQYLKLAREWTEAAAALRVCIDEIDAAENGVSHNKTRRASPSHGENRGAP